MGLAPSSQITEKERGREREREREERERETESKVDAADTWKEEDEEEARMWLLA